MADVKQALTYLADLEGGLSNRKTDRGGLTKYGICTRDYPDEDVSNLTPERAEFLITRDFWTPLRLAEIASQEVANEILEMAVNIGGGRAARIVQKALAEFRLYPPSADGIIGSKTIAAINNFRYPGALVRMIDALQICYYSDLVKSNPSQFGNYVGWVNRG